MPSMAYSHVALMLLCLSAVHVFALDPDRVLFLVRSSAYAEHERTLATELAAGLERDGVPRANVRLLHEMKSKAEYDNWCLLPWIQSLAKEQSSGGIAHDWFFFAESNTRVDWQQLQDGVLGTLDAKEAHFVGHRLQDQNMAVIHHYFTDEKFGYPHAAAGFALSRGALKAVGAAIEGAGGLPYDTHIDVVHETAKYLYDKVTPPIPMTHAGAFCPAQGDKCATWAVAKDGARKSHGLEWSDVVIAVKTTAMFHDSTNPDKDRLAVIKATWGKEPTPCTVVYTSDTVDTVYNTIDIGVNTKKGHCAKTQKILEYFAREHTGKKWFVIADDDTLFYLPRLKRVLDSYDPARPIYLGERYGYGRIGQGAGGYDYVTMGGGVALSHEALKRKLACAHCTCPRPDMFDDMQMGKWFHDIDIDVAHEPGFHQAAPENYVETRLREDQPLSFHKFVMDWDGKKEWISLENTVALYDTHLKRAHDEEQRDEL